MVSKGTARQTQNSEKPSFHGYESDRCLLPVVRAGVRQIIFLLPITGVGNKAGFDFRWQTVTPSVFYYSNYVFHNLYLFSPERNTITRYRSDHEMQIFRFHRRIGISGFNYPYAVDTVRAELFSRKHRCSKYWPDPCCRR